MNSTAAIDDWTFEQQLREMNEALLVSSVRQHELADEARQAAEALCQTEVRLAAELAATQALQELSAKMIPEGDVQPLYEQILDTAVRLLRSDFASLQILYPAGDAADGKLRLLVFRGFNPQAAQFWEWVRPVATSSCGQALSTGQRCIVGDIERCEWMAGSDDLMAYRDTGIRSVQSTPLISRSGHVLGIISTHWRIPHTPSESELRQLDILARQAADFIDRRQADEVLRQSEERYRSLTQVITSVVWTTNAEGRFVTPQPSWSEFTGQTWEESRDFGWVKALHADDRVRVRELWELACASQSLYESDGRLWHAASGCYRHVTARGVPILSPDGSVREWIGKCLDVEDQRRAEKSVERHAVALADLHRRKDEFLAMLGHELRNPLAPITNAVHLLRLQKDEDPLQQQARTVIERQVGQLTRLVDDLLEISRISTGRIHLHQERVALNGIVENAIETALPLIGLHKHSLEASLSPQPIWMYADAARLEQVVVNLLTNAAKYTPDGGQIWLSVQQEGDEGVLRVRDSGVGIAPELLPHIFDLFTQSEKSLDRSQGGLGIGLSLVQRLVEMHRGRVEVYSVLGQGSEFVVRLPVVLTPAPPPTPTIIKVAKPAGPSLRVLVVDDNKDAALTVGMLLQAKGHEVRTAHDGLAALEAASVFRPQVVLLDIGLPGIDGYEVAKRLRQQTIFQNLILVAITGYGQESDRRLSREAGFDHHLVKPVNFEKVQEILETVPVEGV